MNRPSMFPRLFEPARVGPLELRNRMILAPHVTRLPAKNGGITDALVAYYRERARAGVAMVTIEGSYVGRHYPTRFYVGDDSFIPGLKQLADAIHQFGAKAAVQVNVSRGRADELEPIGPSDVPHPLTNAHPKPLTVEEIEWLIDANADGARRIREGGFDAVMVHGAHGYLVSDFLSPLSNRREDEYGGSLENRARFLVQLVRRIQEKAGQDFPIICRIMGSDRVGHFSFEDAAAVSRMLQDAGVCLVDVTTGAAEAYEWAVPSERISRACNVDASEVIKKAVTIPVSVTGRINDPYLAERVLEEGKADFIGMARALDADTDFIRKAAEGRHEEIRRCIACVRCIEFSIAEPYPLRCSVNAFAGRESEIELKPAEQAKRVLVIGGGPAGMEAARIAALRSHNVTLWERSDRLGGQLHLASLPPDKGGLQPLLEQLAGQMAKVGVEVVLNREATPDSVLRLRPDVTIVAVGADPKLPDIPGGDSDRVVTASDVLAGKAVVGQRVVVLARDFLGAEVAEYLADRYRDVTIVEPGEKVAGELIGMAGYFARPPLLSKLQRKMVKMLTSTRALSITAAGVTVADKEGRQRTLAADTVVAAIGFDPRSELFQALEDTTRVYHIGDCAGPGRIMEAIHAAADVALSI